VFRAALQNIAQGNDARVRALVSYKNGCHLPFRKIGRQFDAAIAPIRRRRTFRDVNERRTASRA
jgi:hypothetical protein